MAVRRGSAEIIEHSVHELWWMVMIQGVLAIFFGVVAIFWPKLTLVTLVYLFSAYVLAWGLVEIVRGLMSIRLRDTWWLTLVLGLIGLGVGTYLVRHPAVSLATLLLVIGLTFIAHGILDLVGTFLEDLSTTQRVLTALAGLLAVAAGIILLLEPTSGGVAFVWVLGLYALLFGVLTFTLALEAHSTLDDITNDVG